MTKEKPAAVSDRIYELARKMDNAIDAYDDKPSRKTHSDVKKAAYALFKAMADEGVRLEFPARDPRYTGIVFRAFDGDGKGQGYEVIRDNGQVVNQNLCSMTSVPICAIKSKAYPTEDGFLKYIVAKTPEQDKVFKEYLAKAQDAAKKAYTDAKTIVGKVAKVCVGESDNGLGFSNVYKLRRITGVSKYGLRIILSHEGWFDDCDSCCEDYVFDKEVLTPDKHGDYDIPNEFNCPFPNSMIANPSTVSDAVDRALWILSERQFDWRRFSGRKLRTFAIAKDEKSVWLLLEDETGERKRDLVFDDGKWVEPIAPDSNETCEANVVVHRGRTVIYG